VENAPANSAPVNSAAVNSAPVNSVNAAACSVVSRCLWRARLRTRTAGPNGLAK
jgi:hypothetical protein